MNTIAKPTNAAGKLANLLPVLNETKAKHTAANELLDQQGIADAESSLNALYLAAQEIISIFSPDAVISDLRVITICTAAAQGATPQIKEIAEAQLTSRQDGITLPQGRYEHCSRGKGWCRLGKESSAEWGTRKKGGYRVTTPGAWTVGSDDGYGRKSSVVWTVKKIGGVWIAS